MKGIKGIEMSWELCHSVGDDYFLSLWDMDLLKEKHVIVNITKEEALRLIETTGCEVVEFPF